MNSRTKLWLEFSWYIFAQLALTWLFLDNATEFYNKGTLINLTIAVILFIVMLINTDSIKRVWAQL